MSIPGYAIGIDTGGTYTDAVIIQAADKAAASERRIIATAKALTTKGDLSIGIAEALSRVLALAGDNFERAAINKVCLSTTLATNALVEGHGARVGVFLVGFDDAMVDRSGIEATVAESVIVRINGGHIYTGEPRAELDLAAVEQALSGQARYMDTYAVTARYATRNPRHEQQVKKLIAKLTGRPVTASCELSQALNDPLRSLTTTLNARMIPLIMRLNKAVQACLDKQGIEAEIMIVKGDGSIGSAQAASLKPIETVLSGPAASVIGAQFLTGLQNAVMADIGGTTTDITTIKNGWPSLKEQGIRIAGVKTLVRAIDLQTSGLGGDSQISLSHRGDIQLGSNRLVPISLLAHQYPWVEQALQASLNQQLGMSSALQYILLTQQTVDDQTDQLGLTDKDQAFIAQFEVNQPRPFREVVVGAADRARLARLLKRGLLQMSGFTPTDAAHVLGRQSQWSCRAAELGCELLGRDAKFVSGTNTQQHIELLAQRVVDAVVSRSVHLLVEQLAGKHFAAEDVLLGAANRGGGKVADLVVNLKPCISLIAVGGPAAVYYPDAAKRLGVKAVIPANAAVANAIGAAVSTFRARAVVELSYNENGGYILHGPAGPKLVADSQLAIDKATELACQLLETELSLPAEQAKPQIEISVERINLPGGGDQILMAATVTAEEVG